nr:NADH dehydrogenase subunit 5 [Colpocephalum spinicollis]
MTYKTSKSFIYYMYVYYFMISILIVFLFFFYFLNSNIEFEWPLVSMMDLKLNIKIMISKESMIFMFTVSSIFASVYHYSLQYMEGELAVKRFLLTIVLFVLSMMVLICSGNMFTSLIGWDGLGISSMLLIMYYSSNASLKASMYTFIINRMGDCCFLILVFLSFCISPALSVLEISQDLKLLSVLIVMLSLTKSAQSPFSSWLTKAMEAPTPVSSLVHSSTLVTAGIYILFIYKNLWINNSMMSFMLCILSLTTLFLASVAGLMENDLKKIVAYSTLSQLGFIMFSFSLGMFDQGFFHLIMHAFFKAMMFMSAGYVIHASSGWQDIRLMSLNKSCSPGVTKILITAIVSLCGMPFMTGFYSKDQIIDFLSVENYSLFLFSLLIVSFFFTVLYSFRVCWFLMKGLKKLSSISDDMSIMYNSMILLFILSCFMGSLLTWFMLPNSMINCDSPKILLLMSMCLVLIMFWSFPFVKTSNLYLKSNFYLYILVNLVVYSFSTLSQKMIWTHDLIGIIGSWIKAPTKLMIMYEKSSNNNLSIIYNFKEFFLFLLLILLITINFS